MRNPAILQPLLAIVVAGALACSGPAVSGEPRDAEGTVASDPDGGQGDAPDAGDAIDGGEVTDAGDAAPDVGELSADAGDEPLDGGALATTPFGGECESPFPGVASGSWRHSFATPLATAQGGPNHRIRDRVLSPGESAELRGLFTYGAFDKDLEDEDVELWLRRCPGWERVATATTSHDGIVHVALPTDLPKGEYTVRYLVLGDGTMAEGVVAVWPPGTQAIVTDVDGTLTTSDWQAVGDVVLGRDAEMYDDADTAIGLWAAKGYRLLYLTGRPQAVNRYSVTWLRDHGFPRGPVQLTDEAGQVFPTDSSVRVFKADRLREIRAKGVTWTAAHGNATTDIGAYADAAIPKADTYIVGPYAGEEQTQAVSSYTDRLPDIAAYPDARQP